MNRPIAAIVISLGLSGCVDLSAVATFAKESSAISSNKSMLDDTDAQTQARIFAPESFADPKSKAFTDRLAVTDRALTALNGYMMALAALSANGVASITPEVSAIGTDLKGLKIADPSLQPAVSAAGSLANILLDAMVRRHIKTLVTTAAQPVDDITRYLADQAQTTSNSYNQAIAAFNRGYGNMTQQTDQDQRLCQASNLCKTVYYLADRALSADRTTLTSKAAAAASAATAFRKIQSDNAALVKSVDHLDAVELVGVLKADEPDLASVIRSMKDL